MVIIVKEIKEKKPNYFMTDKEVRLLWKSTKDKWSFKFSMMLGFALFRGMRVGELVAINITDFNRDFTKLRVIFEKSHIEDWLPLTPQLTEMVKGYITKNRPFKDGYLFSFYNSKKKAPHMTAGVAEAFFSKMRKIIGRDHPEFLEKKNFKNGYTRYRITFHSCRRWFETRIHDNIKNKKKLADIMRYIDANTVDTYLNPYETWKEEKTILKSTFEHYFAAFNDFSKGQTMLTMF